MTAVTARPKPQQPARETAGDPGGGDRFVAAALAVTGLVYVAILLLAGELIPPVALFAALYLALGAAVARWAGRRMLIAVVVLVSLHLLTSIPFFAANLAHPESPVSFLVEAFVALAAITALLGAIAGLRGTVERRRIAFAALGLAVVAVVIAVIASAGVESEARAAGDTPVEVAGALFPEQVEVPAGGAVLWVDNQDAFHHTLVVEGTDLRQVLPGSTAVRMDLDLAPGTYRYLCDVPGHERMEGELVVR
jgi:plastocyanin